MLIEVFVRNVYGNPTIYPANDAARTIAELAGTKTLNNRQLSLAQSLGHVVLTVADPKNAVNI